MYIAHDYHGIIDAQSRIHILVRYFVCVCIYYE